MKQSKENDKKIIEFIVSKLNDNGITFVFNYDQVYGNNKRKTKTILDEFENKCDFQKIFNSDIDECCWLLKMIKNNPSSYVCKRVLEILLDYIYYCEDMNVLLQFSELDTTGNIITEIIRRLCSCDLPGAFNKLNPETCEDIADNLIRNIGFDEFCRIILLYYKDHNFQPIQILTLMNNYSQNVSPEKEKLYDLLFEQKNYQSIIDIDKILEKLREERIPS